MNMITSGLGRVNTRLKKAVALLLVTILVFQLIPFSMGATAVTEPVNEPVNSNLWMYPEILYYGSSIYDGMQLGVDAQMQAKYEFTAEIGAFPVEVLLPDGLKAVPGVYVASTVGVDGGENYPGYVVVDETGTILAYLDETPALFSKEGGSAEPGDLYVTQNGDSECCTSCADETGSDEPDDLGFEGEPSDLYQSDETEQVCNEQTEHSHFSESIDGASDIVDDIKTYTVSFTLPAVFNIHNLPPAPAASSSDDAGEEWLVSIFNTVFNGVTHSGEYVTVELIPEETEEETDTNEPVEALFMPLDITLPDLIAAPERRTFGATINWNDNDSNKRPRWGDGDTAPPAARAPMIVDLILQYSYEIDGTTVGPFDLTADILADWKVSTSVPSLTTPRPPARTGSANENVWLYTYTQLPTSLGIENSSALGTIIEGSEIEIIYSFRVPDPASYIDNNFIKSDLTGAGVTGFMYTLKETFEITKVWKDGNLPGGGSRYGTRPDFTTNRNHLLNNLILSQQLGAGNRIDRGHLGTGAGALNVPDSSGVSVTVTNNTTDHTWTIRVSGMPAFDAHGIAYTYSVVEGAGDKLNMLDIVGTRFADEGVYYAAEYENIDNFADESKWVHNNGKIINTLSGDVELDVTKRWLDDTSGTTQPSIDRPTSGRLFLNRYPDIPVAETIAQGLPRRSFRNSSPVSGMDIPLRTDTQEFNIVFKDADNKDVTSFPRFDLDGVEFIYYVQELYTGSRGEYISRSKYPTGADQNTWWEDRNAPGITFNGGTLENLRKADVDLSVTKEWVAAARQDMNANVTVTVWQSPRGANTFTPVDLSTQGGGADGTFVLRGFRAEQMELSHSFTGLPKYDDSGVEYEYRIAESSITMVPGGTETIGELNQTWVLINGYRFNLDKRPSSAAEGTLYTGGSAHLTNTLVGDTEVRVRKIWNGIHTGDDPNWGNANVTFTIHRVEQNGTLTPILPNNSLIKKIEWEWVEDDEGVPTVKRELYSGSTTAFTIPIGRTWRYTGNEGLSDPVGAADDGDLTGGSWLVVSGLPRYDDKGREIEYRVRESSSRSRYHHTFSFNYREEPATPPPIPEGVERLGIVEASLINTPTYGTGRWISVSKDWRDDGDQACRGDVVIGLYYNPSGTGGGGTWTRVGGTTLNSRSDWIGHIPLTGRHPTDEAGHGPNNYDYNFNNYIAVEERILRTSANVTYTGTIVVPAGPSAIANIPTIAGYNNFGTLLGTVTTNAHNYDVRANTTTNTAAELNTRYSITGTPEQYPSGDYRTSYTFRNIRTGQVRISIDKSFTDRISSGENFRDENPHRIEFDIKRSLNYTTTWTTVHTVDTIIGGSSIENLEWDSVTDGASGPHVGADGYFPKYDPNGVLYHYTVEEARIFLTDADGDDLSSNPENGYPVTGGASYKINGHSYSVSSDVTHYWGDHTTEDPHDKQILTPPGTGAVPRPDYYAYTFNNKRSETISDFTVYKLWYDVERRINPNPLELRHRPEIFPRLWHQLGVGGTPVLVGGDGYFPHHWETRTGNNNEYFWTLIYEDLPRYDGAGEEIFYFVDERIPSPGEYKTFYFDTTAAPILGSDSAWIAENVTSVPVRQVNTGANITADVEDAAKPGIVGVGNGGTIVNRRVYDRTMSGRKIWQNVPGTLSSAGYPVIELQLRGQTNHAGAFNVPLSDGNVVGVGQTIHNAELENRGTTIRFFWKSNPTVEARLPKYDNFGIYNLYRALELHPVLGYLDPVYINDYTMDVLNEFDLEGPEVTVTVQKTWTWAPFTMPAAGQGPTAVFDLYREMTDKDGNVIPGTRIKVGEKSILHTQTTPQAFGTTDFRNLPNGETYLLRIGYNGFPFRYTVVERINGFAQNILPVGGYAEGSSDTDITYAFTSANTYDGATESPPDVPTQRYVRLTGTKDWDDMGNVFGTRPALTPQGVQLRIFRSTVGVADSTVEITNAVTYAWSPVTGPGNENRWSYVVTANPIDEQTTGVGTDGTTLRVGVPAPVNDATLYRYATNGQRYIYYVEEVPPSNHYRVEAVVGTERTATVGNFRIEATTADRPNIDNIASFRNVLNTVPLETTKVWQKSMPGTPSVTVPMDSSEFALMLPNSITFKVQYRDSTTSNAWTDFSAPAITIDKEELLNITATGAGNNEQKIVYNDYSSYPLPRFGGMHPAAVTREYRLVETQINRVDIPVTNILHGYTRTADGDDKIINTVETIPIIIRKQWVDEENRDGLRPSRMTFDIERDGDDDMVMQVHYDRPAPTAPLGTPPDLFETAAGTGVTVYVPRYQINSDTATGTYRVTELVGTGHGEPAAHTYYTMTAGSGGTTLPATPPVGTKTFTIDDPGASKVYHFINSHSKIIFNLTFTKTWSDASIDSSLGSEQRDSIRPSHIHVTLVRSVDGVTWDPVPVNGTLDSELKPIDDGLTVGQSAMRVIDNPGGTDEWPILTWTGLTARHHGGLYYRYRVIETPCVNPPCDPVTTTQKAYTQSETYVRGSGATNTSTEYLIWNSTSFGTAEATILNTLDTVSLTVTKDWRNPGGIDPLGTNQFSPTRPIILQLYYRLATGDPNVWTAATGTSNTRTLDGVVDTLETAPWTTAFTNLPKENSAGIAYIYTVREVSIGGVTVENDNPLFSYERTVSAPGAGGVNQTSTVTNTLVKRDNDITVTKVWNDANNQDGVRPASVQVVLIRNFGLSEEFVSAPETLNADNNWTHTWTNLPKFNQNGTTPSTYRVQEILPSTIPAYVEYTSTYQVIGADGTFTTGDMSNPIPETSSEVRIRNTYEPKLMNINVTKSWSPGADAFGAPDHTRPASVMYELRATTNPSTPIASWVVVATSPAVSFAHSFTGFPIRENPGDWSRYPGESKPLHYRVVELRADGSSVIHAYDPTVLYNGSAANTDITGDITVATGVTHTAAVTNTLRRVDLTVTKLWTDYDSAFVLRGEQRPAVEVKLYYRLGNSGDFIPVPATAAATLVLPLNHGNDFTNTFTGLPKENSEGVQYQYTVREVKIGSTLVDPDSTPPIFPYSYTSSVSDPTTAPLGSVAVTNTLQMRNNITITKLWDDSNNRDGVRPASVEVRLIKDMGLGLPNEVISAPVTLNAGNNWTTTFSNLPRYRADGTESTYHVMEVTPITTPSVYTMPVYQIGSSGSFTSGTGTGTTAVSGQPISDLIENLAHSELATVVTVRNSYTPRVMSIAVTKDWDDSSNRFGFRPAEVQVQLFVSTSVDGTANRTAIGSPVPINAGNGWSHTWGDLPVRQNLTGTSVNPVIPGTSNQLYYSVVEIPNPVNSNYLAAVITYALDNIGGTSAGAANANTINGSITDSLPRTHTATVKNSLDSVNVEVLKVWDDHHDYYDIRPTTLTFTLQRRSGTGAWENVNVGGVVTAEVTVSIGYPGADEEQLFQPVEFKNLPRLNTGVSPAVPWQYRVIETAVTGEGADSFVVDSTDQTKGTIGDTSYTYYTFSSTAAPANVDGVFTTTVTNKINVATITISGAKTWNDSDDKLGIRPTIAEFEKDWLKVYYRNTTTNTWVNIPNDELEITWTVSADGNKWSYTIRGMALAMYLPGSSTPQEYNVAETVPSSSLYSLNEGNLENTGDPAYRLTNGTFGQRGAGPEGEANHIINANLENNLSSSVTSLWVSKEHLAGPGTIKFNFKVFVSQSPFDPVNPTGGTQYIHDYYVYPGTRAEWLAADSPALTATSTYHRNRPTVTGMYEITRGQSFVLTSLPQGWYYRIEEVEPENEGFDLLDDGSPDASKNLMGTLPGDTTPTVAVAVNVAHKLVSIENSTPNEGIGTPADLTNAGGMVTVEDPGGYDPGDWDPEEEVKVPDAMAVRWEADTERFWVLGNTFTIRYIDYGYPEEKSVVIWDYLQEDGKTPKASLLDCSYDPADQDVIDRFAWADEEKTIPNAYMQLTATGEIRLVLSRTPARMPREVWIIVEFLPTLAVNNVTEGNVGGTVMVNGVGTPSNNADGVPAINDGVPYVMATSVYGKPDPGYKVDWDYIVIRNLNDLTGELGEPVFVKPDANGYFTTQLQTVIAGRTETVQKTGRVYEGSIIVELNGLPVPLQIDLRFIPDVPIISATDDDPAFGLIMPRTGLVSIINTLALGLITSLIATVTVAIVIRKQKIKQ